MKQQPPRRNPVLAFAHTATDSDAGSNLSLPDPMSLSRAITMLHTVALPFAFHFKPVVVFIAMSWYVTPSPRPLLCAHTHTPTHKNTHCSC